MRLRRFFPAFVVVILLALGLRFAGITFDSLWLDEGYQSLVGATGRGAVPDLLASEPKVFRFAFEKPVEPGLLLRNFRQVDPLCPPLYAVCLNRWITWFGSDDLTLRSMSAIVSTLNCAALGVLGSLLFGPLTGLAAAGFLALSPYDIHYAQEARMYCLEELASTLSSCSLILIFLARRRAPGWIVLYALSTWALINSHYTGLFVVLAQGLLSCVTVLICRRWRLLTQLVAGWAGAIVLWLPWLPLFFQAAAVRKESFYVARQASVSWPFYALFVRIPVNWLTFLSGNRVVAWAAPLYASSAIFLASSLVGLFTDRKDRFALRAVWLWALVPAVLLWLADVLENHRVIEVHRYIIATLPAVALCAGYGLTKLVRWRRRWWWLAAAHAVFCLVNLGYTHSVHQREPWREMAQCVEEHCRPDDLVIVSDYYNIPCLNRYLSRPLKQLGFSPQMGMQSVEDRLRQVRRFAVVTCQKGDGLLGMIPARYKVVDSVDMSHALHFRIYEIQ